EPPAPGSDPLETVELFVAGRRKRLRELGKQLPTWDESTQRGASDLFKIEDFRTATPQDRLRPVQARSREPLLLDVAIHIPDGIDIDVWAAFLRYAEGLGAEPLADRRLDAGGLSFLPVRATPNLIAELGQFTFLRVLRAMPPLRPLNPVIRST